MPVKEKTGPRQKLSSLAVASVPQSAPQTFGSIPRGRPIPRRSIVDRNAIIGAADKLRAHHKARAVIDTFQVLMDRAALARQPIITRKDIDQALHYGKGNSASLVSRYEQRQTVLILEASGVIRRLNNAKGGAHRWHLHLLARHLSPSGKDSSTFWSDMQAANRRRDAAKKRRRRAKQKQQVSEFRTSAENSSDLKQVSDIADVEYKKASPVVISQALKNGEDPSLAFERNERLPTDPRQSRNGGDAAPAGANPAFVCPVETSEIEEWELDDCKTTSESNLPQESSCAKQAVSEEATLPHTVKKAGSQAIASYDQLSESARLRWDEQIVTKFSLYLVRQMVLPTVAAELDIRRLKVQGRRLRNRDLRMAADMLKRSREYTVGELVWRAQRIAMMHGHRRKAPIRTEG